jgi:GNAT superfamily N-acetyltransferase
VYIEKPFRGQGLSKWLMSSLMSDLQTMNLRRICLATKDAHDLYKKFGIEVTKSPENWMEKKDNDIYKKLRP